MKIWVNKKTDEIIITKDYTVCLYNRYSNCLLMVCEGRGPAYHKWDNLCIMHTDLLNQFMYVGDL